MFFFNHSSNRKHFSCLHSLIETREGLGEYETVMQTRDKVDRGFAEGSRLLPTLECLYQAMQIQEKSFLLLL